MNLFQWIAVPALSVLCLVDARRLFRHPSSRWFVLVRLVVWLAAAVAILDPDVTTQVAVLVGIQRGADLVLYLTVLAFLGVAFYLYARSVRAERQLTEVVRHLAIVEARQQVRADET